MTPDVWAAVRAVKFLEKGFPPAAGGQLDQAEIFMQAAAVITAEQEKFKAEMNGK